MGCVLAEPRSYCLLPSKQMSVLRLEHGQPGITQQLHTQVDTTSNKQQAQAVAASLGMEAATPPDDDDEMFTAAGGCGGSGEYCWLTVNALVHFAAPPAAAPAGP